MLCVGVPDGSSGEESACNARDRGDVCLIAGWGRSPGGGHGNPLQYSWLENPMNRGARWATVHRVAKSQTGLKQLSAHTPRNRINITSQAIWLFKSIGSDVPWDLIGKCECDPILLLRPLRSWSGCRMQIRSTVGPELRTATAWVLSLLPPIPAPLSVRTRL